MTIFDFFVNADSEGGPHWPPCGGTTVRFQQFALSVCGWLTWIAVAMLFVIWPKAMEAAASEQDVHIQAHRGAGIERPENTLETFNASWGMGVTPEADLRMTKDGVIVCFHDADLRRVVSNADHSEAGQGIEQLSYSRVRELEVGAFRGEQFTGQHVPALADVFAAMRDRPDRLLYLDIKSIDLDKLAELVRSENVERQVIFTSEHYQLLRDWMTRVPESLTLLWNRGTEEQLDAKFDKLRAKEFAGISHLQIHARVGDLASGDPFTPSSKYLKNVIREMNSRGIVFQVIPWECSDRRAYVKLLELGVPSFATDYPQVTLEAIREFQATNRVK
jgi:glycerophosphoryl diester phosphodiesterase